MEENRFTIDFFEFAFLVEACIPPRPIARAMFWDSVIDKHYHAMTPDERTRLYTWIKKNWVFEDGIKNGNEDCLLFEARFNPDNQWKVTTKYNGEIQEHDCFKWKGGYHISKSTSVQDDYVIGCIQTLDGLPKKRCG
jgi:hypothetical protein